MIAAIPTYGLIAEASVALLVAVASIAVLTAGFHGLSLWIWTTGIAAFLWLTAAPVWVWAVLAPFIVLHVPQLRRSLISDRALAFLRKKELLPVISDTERTAIEAGDVWVDGELFSGKPDFDDLINTPFPELTSDERAFLDGPVERVCALTDDWQVSRQRDLPPDVWSFLKEAGFFGMIIPRQYGGLGFSCYGHSAVIQKLASRSLPLAITVMVPNSLGPAELLLHSGTRDQKDHYLPRLASGEEIPCFALTEPHAGSDAAAMRSRGVVFRRDDGELCLRLDWDKRYITLAAVATVLGLAFKLEDPDNLLGRGAEPGITCALIPTTADGVELGRRHDPLGVPFYNCPTRGEGVVVPVSAIIGGVDGVGEGWRMLMECLAAGRGISLPATSTGGAKLVARATGAYAAVRKQFGVPIGKFEGIEEPLARIAGTTYMLEAARRFTCGGLDNGIKPPVVTAMVKYSFTERFRRIINDGMDVLGGAAISRGPNNVLAEAYTGVPISITVEGANILTRTLMVFGQGAIRCHRYAFREIEALAKGDKVAFDRAFCGHAGQVVRNAFRCALLNLTRGRAAASPVRGHAARYWRRLAWASAEFATLADMAMAGLGGALKRKEKITGRFADVFSAMYMGTAVLRRFEAEGRRREDVPLMQWSMETLFEEIQVAFDGLYRNMRLPGLRLLMRGPFALWSRLNPIGSGPSDHLGGAVARTILSAGAQRDALTEGMFLSESPDRGIGRLDRALELSHAAEPAVQKIKAAIRTGSLPRRDPGLLVEAALAAEVVTADEGEALRVAEQARAAAIAVDCFTLEEYLGAAAQTEEVVVVE